jgi:PAS domain-containing protein
LIVGKDFIWTHFPKTAGHAVDSALKLAFRGRRDIAFDAPDCDGWHESVQERAQRDPNINPSSKVVLSGFRRLPHWLLSRVHYEALRPPYLTVDRAMLCRGEFFQRDGTIARADDHALHFGGPEVQRWIRTEHLAEDFERHFGDILDNSLMRAAVKKLRRIVNGTRLNYIRSLDFYFKPAELAALYEANPIWAALERRLYGDILRISDRRYFVNRKLQIIAASDTALKFWGKTAPEILGRHFLEVFPLARNSPGYNAHERALRTAEPVELSSASPTYSVPVQGRVQLDDIGRQVTFDILAT